MTYSEIIQTRPDLADEMEEYAGKMEYDNELTRPEAEYETAKIMHKRYLIFARGNLFHQVDTQTDV